MNVIILDGKNISSDIKEIYRNINNPNIIFMLDNENDKERWLCDYIDSLHLQDDCLYRLRICQEVKNLNVSFGISDSSKYEAFTKMSSIIEKIDDDYTYDIIVNDNNRKMLSEIIQQLIYLNISLDKVRVMTKQEIKDAGKIKRFENNIKNLEESIDFAAEKIKAIDAYEELIDEKEDVLRSLKKISDAVHESLETELVISVAASKKTGKSVLVNCMIEEEIAPTSLELATPNNCVYKPSKTSNYKLEYNKQNIEFQDVNKLKKYILKEFKAAEKKTDGFDIPDMHIEYLTDKNVFSKYTIYDTPGPDLAGATGHKRAAEEAIKKSDVVLFAIDYTKYLTDSEVKYLDHIKNVFESNNKFYSLIFTVNKIDERFISSGNKSVTRILDFIRKKISLLDSKFENCIIMGTSSLTYFNSLEVTKIPNCDILNTSFSEQTLKNCIKALKTNYDMESDNKSNYITVLNYIKEQVGRMDDFYDITAEKLEDVKQFSGVPDLLNYINYVSVNKARNEKLNNLTFVIDNEYAKIRNKIHLQELEEELKKNHELIEEIREYLNNFIKSVEYIFDVNGFEKEYLDNEILEDNREVKVYKSIREDVEKEREYKNIKDVFYSIEKNIRNDMNKQQICNELVDESIRKKLKDKMNELFKESTGTKIVNGKIIKVVGNDKIINHFIEQIENIDKILVEKIDEKLKQNSKNYNDLLQSLKNSLPYLLDIKINKLSDEIEKCKKNLKKDYNIEFQFEIPVFDFCFQATDISNLNVILNLEELNSKIKDKISNGKREVLKDTWWRKLKSIFSYPETLGHFDFDKVYDHIKDTLIQTIMNSNLENHYKSAVDETVESFKNAIEKMDETFCVFEHNVNDTVNRIKNILDNSKDIEKNIKLLEQKRELMDIIHENSNQFFNLWMMIKEDE